MSKNSKAYREAAEKIDRDRLYTPLEAAKLAKETSSKKQDATVEVAIRLGVDPRKADQLVRGTVNLPHGTGKTARVAVFAVGDIKGGKINFRVDKQANLHFIIGKASFGEKQLAENYGAALDEILRAKPSSSKGRYLKKIVVSTTTGPGIPVDPAVTRNFAEA